MISDEQHHFFTEIASILEHSQFDLSTPLLGSGGCFDLIAKKHNILLLVKLLLNIDSMREEQAYELQKLALMLDGFPFIVGKRIRSSQELEDGVVYTRYDIPSLSIETFRNLFVNNLPPLIYACRGGFKVKFDGTLLKEKRLQKNYSLGDFAREIGISKSAVYDYEHGTVDVSLETAMKIEELLDEPLTMAINLFENMKRIGSISAPKLHNYKPKSNIEREVKKHFDNIGLKDQLWTKKIPIRVLAKCVLKDESEKSSTTVTSISETSDAEDYTKKLQVTYNISRIAEADPLLVVGSKEVENYTIDGVPILSIDDLIKKKKKKTR